MLAGFTLRILSCLYVCLRPLMKRGLPVHFSSPEASVDGCGTKVASHQQSPGLQARFHFFSAFLHLSSLMALFFPNLSKKKGIIVPQTCRCLSWVLLLEYRLVLLFYCSSCALWPSGFLPWKGCNIWWVNSLLLVVCLGGRRISVRWVRSAVPPHVQPICWVVAQFPWCSFLVCL